MARFGSNKLSRVSIRYSRFPISLRVSYSRCSVGYSPKAGLKLFRYTIGLWVEVFGGAKPRVPDHRARRPFRLLSIPSGQLTQSYMIGFHGAAPYVSLCSAA